MRNIPPFKRRALACFVTTLLLIALLPARAAAWGDQGHHIVAMIAEKNLSNTARTRVAQILGQGNRCNHGDVLSKMLCAAVWPDESRKTTHKFTYNWHFVDISLHNPNYNESRDCEPENQAVSGKCGIFGLDHARSILRGDTSDPHITRAQALMFVIHIVGDLHQPLHTVLEKTGGNGLKVTYFNISTDLHKVWDTKIIESEMIRSHQTETQYADMLEGKIEAAGLSSFQQGDPVSWLNETHARAINDAYGTTLPSGNHPQLGKPYLQHNLPVVNLQLERGGARLARILSEDLH
jgi:hypothetical protein